MRLKTFIDVEKVLESTRPDIKAVNWFFALSDMQKLMAALGDPQEKVNIIHVAGTSGKTSTSYYIANMLKQSGIIAGLSVSPHVDEINERAQINLKPLDQTEFCEQFSEFISLPSIAKINITYFGLLATFAYWLFAAQDLRYGVIEVGMGGRYDATNVTNNRNKICIITDIGLDHTQFLGNDMLTIAREKAGIIKPGNQVFVANQKTEIIDVFKQVASEQHATIHVLPLQNIAATPKHLPPFQKRNWALAKFAYDYLSKRDKLAKLSQEDFEQTAQIQIPARMQPFKYNGKVIITDGSHNSQKITALVEGIKQKYPGKSVAAMVSFADGKDSSLSESMEALRAISETLIITRFNNEQDTYREAINPEIIEKVAVKFGFLKVQIIDRPKAAFNELLKQSEDVLLVTGSFFLLNHVRPIIREVSK